MGSLLSKKIVISSIIIQILLASFCASQFIPIKGQGLIVIKILDPTTELNSMIIGNESEPLPPGGIPFTVKVFLSGLTENLKTFQVRVIFNNSYIECTGAWVPQEDPSFVFYEKTIVSAVNFTNIGSLQFPQPQVTVGASSISDAVTVESGLLFMINFTAKKIGTTNIYVAEELLNTFLLDNFAMDIEIDLVESFTVAIAGAKSPPAASFAVLPQPAKANQTVTFDASGSYDADGVIVSYLWDFGDGNTTLDGKSINHTYTSNGLYLANLTVTDDENKTDWKTIYVLVGYPPEVVFSYTPALLLVGDVASFNATGCTDPDNGTLISYSWNFGDGNTTVTTEPTINHTYTSRGVFIANLTVADNDSLFNSTTREVMVGIPPTAFYTVDPQTQKLGESLYFDGSLSTVGEDPSIYPNVSIALYSWDFEEAIISTNTSSIAYVFVSAGNWTVTLTVYDSDGLYSSYSEIVEITYVKPAKAFDWTLYIIAAVFIAIIVSAFVIKKRRDRMEEQAIEI